MQAKRNLWIVGMILTLFALPFVAAAGNTQQVTFSSQPSQVLDGSNYAATFSLTDSANLTANYTAQFNVNGVNVANSSATNVSTTPGSNSYTVTFSPTYFSPGKLVNVTINAKEFANASVTTSNTTSTLTVSPSSVNNAIGYILAIGTFFAILLGILLLFGLRIEKDHAEIFSLLIIAVFTIIGILALIVILGM